MRQQYLKQHSGPLTRYGAVFIQRLPILPRCAHPKDPAISSTCMCSISPLSDLRSIECDCDAIVALYFLFRPSSCNPKLLYMVCVRRLRHDRNMSKSLTTTTAVRVVDSECIARLYSPFASLNVSCKPRIMAIHRQAVLQQRLIADMEANSAPAEDVEVRYHTWRYGATDMP